MTIKELIHIENFQQTLVASWGLVSCIKPRAMFSMLVSINIILASMILDIRKFVSVSRLIYELKELFQKPSCVKDIMISGTLFGCNMIV